MEEKHDVVTPVFKIKKEMVNKPIFSPRPVVKVQVENIKLIIFKGTNLGRKAGIGAFENC